MSLFKDITDELEQAVNEISVDQADEEEDLFALFAESDDVEVDQDLLDTMLEDENIITAEAPAAPVVEETIVAEEPVAVPEPVVEEAAPVVPEPVADVQAEVATTPVEEVPEAAKSDLSDEDRNAVTVITKGTTINGSIVSDCSLEVMGTINGDIECLGKLTISGKVTGNSLASDVVVNTDRLEGSIVSEGNVKIGHGTIVIGDITATSAEFAGAIKGEIDVKGPVILDSSAIIKGNIKAKSIQMNNGAVMDGFCSLSYAELQIDEIFE